MTTFVIDGNVVDQNGAPVPGALAYIYDYTGTLAPLLDGLGQTAPNPVTSDEIGYFSAYVADSGFYTLKYFWGSRLRYVEAGKPVGEEALAGGITLGARDDALTAAVDAGDSAGAAATSEANAIAARTGAETARDAAQVAAAASDITDIYADEATGRAAVADGVKFKAYGATSSRVVDVWQRVNSGSSTLINSSPALSLVNDAINAGVSRGREAVFGVHDPRAQLFDFTRTDNVLGKRKSTGSLYNAAGWFVAHPMQAKAGGSFTLRVSVGNVSFYDKDMNWVAESGALAAGTHAVPGALTADGFMEPEFNYGGDDTADGFLVNEYVRSYVYVTGNSLAHQGYRRFGKPPSRWQGAPSIVYGDSQWHNGYPVNWLVERLGIELAVPFASSGVSGRTMLQAATDILTFASDFGVNWADIKLFGIWLAQNDHGGNVTLGALSDPAGTANFTGATRTIVEFVLDACTIGGVLQTQLFDIGGVRHFAADVPNGQGLTLGDYNARLEEIMASYGIPVFNPYKKTQFNSNTWPVKFYDEHIIPPGTAPVGSYRHISQGIYGGGYDMGQGIAGLLESL